MWRWWSDNELTDLGCVVVLFLVGVGMLLIAWWL
jgi:hypothetical protein